MKRLGFTLIVVSLTTGAQAVAQTKPSIPIRELSPAEAVSKASVGFVYGVRELSDGRVLVNDAGTRRLLLLDRSLEVTTIVADSATGSGTSYGRRPTGMIPYAGDSTLLVDLAARAFLLVDPRGKIVRVMSAPRPSDIDYLWNPAFGSPRFDPRGRLVYRSWIMPRMHLGGQGVAPSLTIADSAPILRGDFDTRMADTLGWLRIPRLRATMMAVPGGRRMVPIITPLSMIDDWAMLPDGSVAILRGQDYHLDWIEPDGKRSATPKMPFDWKRLSDEEKTAIIDSARKQLARQGGMALAGGGVNAEAAASVPLPNPMMAAPHTIPGGGTPEADGPPARHVPADSTKELLPDVARPDELPDYMPPVMRPGTMKVDPAGNIWVLPSTSTQAGSGLLYDVINRQGEIFQRVRLPQGRALEGFGAGGVVYLSSHEGGVTRIERVRLP